MVNQAMSLVSIERLTKYPDVEKRYKYPRANRPEGFWQPTSTHRPLMQKKSCSEELFQKNCLRRLFQKHCSRRYCSEDLVLKEKFLTTRTPRTSRTSRTPRTSRTSQFCSRRRIVLEAVFENNCLRRNVSEDLVLREGLLTSDTPDTPDIPDFPDVPDIPDIPKEAVKQFSTIVFSSEALVFSVSVC